MILKVETGDTGRQRELISVSLELINDNTQIQFSMLGNTANLSCNDWEKFYEQVDKRELHKWQSGEIELPIGSDDFKQLTQNGIYNSTCSFQLFLAIVDIANELNFCQIYDEIMIDTFLTSKKSNIGNPYEIKVIEYFLKRLQNRLIGSDKSLFILPYFSNQIDNQEMDLKDLIEMNQLGTITLLVDVDKFSILLYRPYSAPFGSGLYFNERQKEILNIIKDLKRSAI